MDQKTGGILYETWKLTQTKSRIKITGRRCSGEKEIVAMDNPDSGGVLPAVGVPTDTKGGGASGAAGSEIL